MIEASSHRHRRTAPPPVYTVADDNKTPRAYEESRCWRLRRLHRGGLLAEQVKATRTPKLPTRTQPHVARPSPRRGAAFIDETLITNGAFHQSVAWLDTTRANSGRLRPPSSGATTRSPPPQHLFGRRRGRCRPIKFQICTNTPPGRNRTHVSNRSNKMSRPGAAGNCHHVLY